MTSLPQRYQLLEEVGKGGMAVVYRGLDTTLDREVAVKVLHPHLASQPESRARLEREAHAVAKLRHENILEIYDYSGPESSEAYIVTEFIHGTTLKQFVSDHPLHFPEVAEMIASEVARALEHAHHLGIIHRDIKPENVMIRSDGLIKLTDFGIAQIVDKERMTITGQLLGSPAYMSPEHVEGRTLDFRTDVFGVGIITYQLACGQLPFRGKNPHEVLKRIAECSYPPPEAVNPRVGARLAKLLKKALARDPLERYADVALLRAELLQDLRDAGVDDPREELRRFFAAPASWERGFRPRLVAALVRRGRELDAGGRTAAALELWGRALELDPDSAELKALVAAAARRRGLSRLGLAAAAGALGIAGVALAVHGYQARQTTAVAPRRATSAMAQPARVEPGLPAEREPEREPAERRPAPPASEAAPGRHALAPRTRRVSAPDPLNPLKRRVVELVPTPKAVRVLLDDKLVGDYGPQLSRLELPPGEHKIAFVSPVCYPAERVIGASESPEKLSLRLKWKPAQLTVKARPETAHVLVGDLPPAPAGTPIPITIPELSPDGRRSVRIKVMAPGHTSRELDVVLRANEVREETVELRPLGPE